MIKQTGIMVVFALLLLSLASCQDAAQTKTADNAANAPASAAVPGGGAELALASATYDVEGMTCDHCVQGISETLAAVPGVRQCQVDLANHCAKVEYDPAQVDDAKLIDSINALGYTATLAADKPNLDALAGESGCVCGAEGGSGECSGECGDPMMMGEGKAKEGCGMEGSGGGCGSCEGSATAAMAPAEVPAGCEREVYYVEGLGCPNSAAKLAAGINALAGVNGSYVDIKGGTVTVDFEAATADPKNFESAITGFGLVVLDGPPAKDEASPANETKAQDA